LRDPRLLEADEKPLPEQQERARKLISLLRQWRDEDQGEEDDWPLVEEMLKGIRMRCGD